MASHTLFSLRLTAIQLHNMAGSALFIEHWHRHNLDIGPVRCGFTVYMNKSAIHTNTHTHKHTHTRLVRGKNPCIIKSCVSYAGLTEHACIVCNRQCGGHSRIRSNHGSVLECQRERIPNWSCTSLAYQPSKLPALPLWMSWMRMNAVLVIDIASVFSYPFGIMLDVSHKRYMPCSQMTRERVLARASVNIYVEASERIHASKMLWGHCAEPKVNELLLLKLEN